jgi:hypothetical protein
MVVNLPVSGVDKQQVCGQQKRNRTEYRVRPTCQAGHSPSLTSEGMSKHDRQVVLMR